MQRIVADCGLRWGWGRIHMDLVQRDCEDGRPLEISLDHI